MHWTDGNGYIELNITKKQARIGSHHGVGGRCDEDIEWLSAEPTIKKQLDKIDKDTLKEVLSTYGCYSDSELENHEQNCRRILWMACGDIMEDNHLYGCQIRK